MRARVSLVLCRLVLILLIMLALTPGARAQADVQGQWSTASYQISINPIHSALLEGARWWTQAFEAAGFKNAFHVELLPEGADPMDLRYNVIQWIHRATRGWSYGATVTDPRTGEIIKGHVSLGSLRVRQDYLIAEGLHHWRRRTRSCSVWSAAAARSGRSPSSASRRAP